MGNITTPQALGLMKENNKTNPIEISQKEKVYDASKETNFTEGRGGTQENSEKTKTKEEKNEVEVQNVNVGTAEGLMNNQSLENNQPKNEKETEVRSKIKVSSAHKNKTEKTKKERFSKYKKTRRTSKSKALNAKKETKEREDSEGNSEDIIFPNFIDELINTDSRENEVTEPIEESNSKEDKENSKETIPNVKKEVTNSKEKGVNSDNELPAKKEKSNNNEYSESISDYNDQEEENSNYYVDGGPNIERSDDQPLVAKTPSLACPMKTYFCNPTTNNNPIKSFATDSSKVCEEACKEEKECNFFTFLKTRDVSSCNLLKSCADKKPVCSE